MNNKRRLGYPRGLLGSNARKIKVTTHFGAFLRVLIYPENTEDTAIMTRFKSKFRTNHRIFLKKSFFCETARSNPFSCTKPFFDFFSLKKISTIFLLFGGEKGRNFSLPLKLGECGRKRPCFHFRRFVSFPGDLHLPLEDGEKNGGYPCTPHFATNTLSLAYCVEKKSAAGHYSCYIHSWHTRGSFYLQVKGSRDFTYPRYTRRLRQPQQTLKHQH